MEFFDTPRKIRWLRKQLHMRQYELSSEHITTAFISMIELGKRRLTRHTAEKIAEKMNEKAKKLGLSLEVDGDYLLCSPEEEAEEYCAKMVNQTRTMEEGQELLAIAKRYHAEKAESKIHQFIGDMLFEEKRYEEAFVEYSYALDLCKNAEEGERQPYLYNRGGLCKLNILKYSEALFLFDRASHYAKQFNKTQIEAFTQYNMALCHMNLGNFDAVLEFVSSYSAICNKVEDPTTYIYAQILKANCLNSRKELEKALEIYYSLLEEFKNLDGSFLGFIYTNMGEIYLGKKLYVESLEYFNKAQKIREKIEPFKLGDTLIEKSKLYLAQQFREESILLIEMALESAEENRNKACLVKGYTILKDLYRSSNDEDKLKIVYEKLAQLLDPIENEKELLRIYSTLALLSLEKNDQEKARQCLILSQNLAGKKINSKL